MHELIKLLQRKQLLWHAHETVLERNFISTNFDQLDAKLQGGLPQVGVVEINSLLGIGELRLLMPYLKNQIEGLTVFINPPGIINAEHVYEQGITLNNIIVIYTATEQEALWAAEQCLKSSACSTVLHWYQTIEVHHVKRFQVAAEMGDCLHVLLRTPQKYALSLPVSLSMTLASDNHGIEITVAKRKGGWPLPPFTLDMRTLWPTLTVSKDSANIIAFPNASNL